MILDAFMLSNELDILEGRMEYLSPFVDAFVIIESDTTHSGASKPFNFENNASRFRKYLSKTFYHKLEVDKSKFNFNQVLEQTDYRSDHWKLENLQRNAIVDAVKSFSDINYVMISDVDEIPNKRGIAIAAANLSDNNPWVGFRQKMFYYNFKQYQEAPWPGTVLTTIGKMKEVTPQYLRDIRGAMPYVIDGGWHLSYWGSIESIKNKINNTAHQEFNKDNFKDEKYIQEQIARGNDLFGRNNPFVPTDLQTIPEEVYNIFSKIGIV